MSNYFEPIKGPGAERRDELGNTAPYRKHPHRGSDWGFTTGSAGKPVHAIASGTVTKNWYDEALGWSLIVKNDADANFIEYNHLQAQSARKRGEKVIGGETTIGLIGCTGTALSASGANHLHASCAPAPVPHAASYAILKDLFALIGPMEKPAPKPAAKKPAAKK
jgi:murein DD-endopeptidase MepM/ murein hydrolase activator NlpD